MFTLIDRLIDEKESIKYEEYVGSDLVSSTKIEKGHLKFMKSFIDNQPVIALHKTGYWISNKCFAENTKTPMIITCKCSNCGATAYEETNFCPYCGSDMR